MRTQLPEQWPPFGLAIPFAFQPRSITPSDLDFYRRPDSLSTFARTRFRDRQGNEYTHEKRYSLDTVRDVLLAHRLWLRGLA